MPSKAIYDEVIAAMQNAEEIGGPEGDYYLGLMSRIAAEATARAATYRVILRPEGTCCTAEDYLRQAGLKVGDRVRLRRDVERYPHFIARKGSTGVIVPSLSTTCAAWVRMTDLLPNAVEWDNAIMWFEDTLAHLAGDLELDQPKEEPMGYDDVIDQYLQQLTELIDKNRDDDHDLASWIAALDTHKAALVREFNDHLLEAVLKPQKEIVREVVFHTVRADNK